MNLENGSAHKNKRVLYFYLLILFAWCFCNTAMAEVKSHQTSQTKTPEGLTQSDWTNIQEQINFNENKSLPLFEQQAFLKASNIGMGDSFGISVAVSGDTLVVGAFLEDSSTEGVDSTPDDLSDNAGAAYVFIRNEAGIWIQHAYLKASNPGVGDYFGLSVAISGDTIVVGAYGESSSSTGVDSIPNDLTQKAGAAYVFHRNEAGNWSQQAYLKASNPGVGDYFGLSVAVSGDTVVVGAQNEDSSTEGVDSTPDDLTYDAGAAYVFIRNEAGIWSQQAYLKASNPGVQNFFGKAVAISGDTVVVGAPRFEAAYVFARSEAGIWSQQTYLLASNTDAGDYFGHSIALLGDDLVVGAMWEDSSSTGVNSIPDDLEENSGAVYVFHRNEVGDWVQQAYLKASNTGEQDQFGRSVAVFGDLIVIGADFESSSSTGVDSVPNDLAQQAGAAYVFHRNEAGDWVQQAYLKASNTDVNDRFGKSVSVSGNMIAVGAIYGGNSVFSPGAAYVFIDVNIIFQNGFESQKLENY